MEMILNNGPTVLLILAGVLVGFGALIGLFRGFKRAFIHFLFVAVAIFGSLFACRYFLSNTEKVLNHPWTQKLLGLLKITVLDQLKEQVPDAYDLLIGLPVAILSPVFFTLLFFAAAIVLWLVAVIIGFFAGPKHSFHLLGGVIGAAQGAVVTVAIMVPLCGLLTNAVSAIDTIEEEKDDRYNVAAVDQLSNYKEQILSVTDAPIYKLVDKYAGTPICNSLMRYEVDGKEVNVKEETDNVAALYAHSFPLIGTNIKAYTQDQIDAMDKLVEDIDKSSLFPRLIAAVLNAAGNGWLGPESDGTGTFLSIEAPQITGEFQEAMIELYKVLANTSAYPKSDAAGAKTEVAANFDTLVRLMDVFDNHGIFPIIDDADAIKNKLSSDPTLIPHIRDALKNNEYHNYDAVCDALERAAVKAVVASYIDIPEKSSPEYIEYHQMTTDIANALNGVSSSDLQSFFDDPDSFIGSDVQTALDDNPDVAINSEMITIAKDLLADAMAQDPELKEKLEDPDQTITAEDVEAFLAAINAGN